MGINAFTIVRRISGRIYPLSFAYLGTFAQTNPAVSRTLMLFRALWGGKTDPVIGGRIIP